MTTTSQNNNFEHLSLSWEIVYTFKVALNIVFHQPLINIRHLVQQPQNSCTCPCLQNLQK